jgi:hypothetical protein
MAYIRALKYGQTKDAVCYVLTGVLAVYFHLYAFLVIGAQVVIILGLSIRHVARPDKLHLSRSSFRILWLSFFAIGIFSLICYLPVVTSLVVNIHARGCSSFEPLFPWRLLKDLSGNPGTILVLAMILLAGIGLKVLSAVDWRLAIYCVGITVVPLGAVMLVRPADLYSRFFIYLLPWYSLLLSLGTISVWRNCWQLNPLLANLARAALIVVTLGIGYHWLSIVSWNYATGPFGGNIAPYRSVGKVMLAQTEGNVCLCAFGEGCEELSYYIGRKMRVIHTMSDLKECLEAYEEVRCAYNVTIWDTPEELEMANFLETHGKTQRFSESRPCQEVILYTMRAVNPWAVAKP